MNRGVASLGAFGLVGRSFRLVYEGFGFLFPLGFVPALALTAATYALVGGPTTPLEEQPLASPDFFAALAVNLVGGFLVTGIMCLAALDVALGKRHGLAEYLGQTLRHLGPIVVLGTLLSIATGLAATLLVIPGIYVMARYLPWAAAALFENAGWSALGRAQDLTAGRRWPIAGATLVMGLAILGVTLLISPLLVMAEGNLFLSALVEAAASAIFYALISAFSGLVYLRLREIREGLSPAEVAATID